MGDVHDGPDVRLDIGVPADGRSWPITFKPAELFYSNLPEADANYVIYRFTTDGAPIEVQSQISWISTEVDERTRTVAVRAVVDNPLIEGEDPQYGGQRLLDMGLALAGAPRVLLTTFPGEQHGLGFTATPAPGARSGSPADARCSRLPAASRSARCATSLPPASTIS